MKHVLFPFWPPQGRYGVHGSVHTASGGSHEIGGLRQNECHGVAMAVVYVSENAGPGPRHSYQLLATCYLLVLVSYAYCF